LFLWACELSIPHPNFGKDQLVVGQMEEPPHFEALRVEEQWLYDKNGGKPCNEDHSIIAA
jgi:hypothetical protein